MLKFLTALLCWVGPLSVGFADVESANATTAAPHQVKKTEDSNLVFKQRQFELGAEMLPYIAPWITEAAKPCMDSIKKDDQDSLSKSADCTAKAVENFKRNPRAFISRLPASDRAKLEAISQDKLKISSPQANTTKKEK